MQPDPLGLGLGDRPGLVPDRVGNPDPAQVMDQPRAPQDPHVVVGITGSTVPPQRPGWPPRAGPRPGKGSSGGPGRPSRQGPDPDQGRRPGVIAAARCPGSHPSPKPDRGRPAVRVHARRTGPRPPGRTQCARGACGRPTPPPRSRGAGRRTSTGAASATAHTTTPDDRRRGEGAGTVEAMRETVPLFGRAPHARPGEPGAERRGLTAPGGLEDASRDADAGSVREPGRGSEAERQVELRGRRIVRQLQARALAERGYALSPDELATTLGATTTLPGDVIARLAHGHGEDRLAVGAAEGQVDGLSSDFSRRSPGGATCTANGLLWSTRLR